VSEAGEHLELLKNAVRQSIAALTAVETDTVYRANELTKMLQAEIGERPNETLSLSVDAGASQLLYQARRISEDWADEEGVLFIIDDGGKDEGKRYPFWVEMNALRESWAALNCHVIFFLLPHNYRMLLQVADHLTDWMPVKLRILSEAENINEKEGFITNSNEIVMEISLSPKAARQQLSILEKQLAEALQREVEPSTLIRRYYLPMFEASVVIFDLNRAQSLREKISEADVAEIDLPQWWYINHHIDYFLKRFYPAKAWAEKMLEWALNNKSSEVEAKALHSLGMVAIEQHDLEGAEKWHRKALDIQQKNDYNYGEAISYHQLGNISYRKGELKAAENFYQKSLLYTERYDFFYTSAINYHWLGMIATKHHDFDNAEKWYHKALTIFENSESEHRSARVYYRLGEVAYEKRNFESSEKLYKKALISFEKQGYEHWSARTYRHLGILARLQDRLESSGEWLIKSIKAFENSNDPENAEKAKEEFQKTYVQASPNVQVKLKEMWDEAGLSEP